VGSGLDRWLEQRVAARLHQRSRPDGDLVGGGRVREAPDEPGCVLEGLHLRHRSLDGRRGRIVCGVGVEAAERDSGAGGHPGSGIDQGIGHEGRPVIGFTFCVQADDVGFAATTGLAVAQAAGAAAAEGPEYYDIVVVPHSAIVVPPDEFDIPMPD
jgi:hypothetical protein